MLENMEPLDNGMIRLRLVLGGREIARAQAEGGPEAVDRLFDQALEDALLQVGVRATAMRRMGAVMPGLEESLYRMAEVVPRPEVRLAPYRELRVRGIRIEARGHILSGAEERQTEAALQQAVLEQITARSAVELPEALVDARVEGMLSHLSTPESRRQLGPAFRNLRGEALAKALRPQAENLLKQELVLDAIAEAEGLRVSQREADAAVTRLAEEHGQPQAVLREKLGRDGLDRIRISLRRRKALAYLTAQAVRE